MAAGALLASGKRERETEDVEMSDTGRSKMARREETPCSSKSLKKPPVKRTLQPAPFFYYKDFSQESDPDPLTPLTAPGRVPNFPAKMHAILSRGELQGIVAWLPHGRSWKVLKPREFEVKVLPKFFEHAKFSSFVRQANGWGFRRILKGPDRNSYYHEKFLRGLPHLSKGMMRPKVAEKVSADPSQEPDLYKISELHPLPDKLEDEAILLQCTLQGGPRARVPIYSGPLANLTAASLPKADAFQLPPRDQLALGSFQQSVSASENSIKLAAIVPQTAAVAPPSAVMPLPSFLHAPPAQMLPMAGPPASTFSALAAANQLSMQAAPPATTSAVAAAALSAQAASQFAAGFAAATAFSQHQFRSILGNLAAVQQQQQHHQQPPPNGLQNLQNLGLPPSGYS